MKKFLNKNGITKNNNSISVSLTLWVIIIRTTEERPGTRHIAGEA
jgi:hypothetical protein